MNNKLNTIFVSYNVINNKHLHHISSVKMTKYLIALKNNILLTADLIFGPEIEVDIKSKEFNGLKHVVEM